MQQAEMLASKFRTENGLGQAEPVSVKTLLRKLQITVRCQLILMGSAASLRQAKCSC